VVCLIFVVICALQWISPSLYVCNYGGISPQFYEMGRLSKFDKLTELHQFAKKRQNLGVERLMSVRVMCRDAILLVLPGKIRVTAELHI